ncbi:MAG: peptidase M23 [Moraxellaceae bacterium]|nr:MAG: peptidase M23 [Moraxellaceae bacterium]
MKLFKIFLLIVSITSAISALGAIYKYKDESGKWIFSDKKPSNTIETEELHFKTSKKEITQLTVYTEKEHAKIVLKVKNPFYAPVEVEIQSSIFKASPHKLIVPAATTLTLYESDTEIPKYRYRSVLGSPNAKEDRYRYQTPVVSYKDHRITQSFNGNFSHTRRPNKYAVDIAMPVGTYIGASRAGTVIAVKDDYPMAGTTQYFLDKANYVSVLHEDGTYAIYAHILLGSSMVKPGDTVKAGDKLARSGSSGFSTGPHLHFVIRKNEGFRTRSVRFVFADKKGGSYTPKRGMRLDGVHDTRRK